MKPLFQNGDDSGFTGTFTSPNNANAVVRFISAAAGSANASWVFNQPVAGRTTLEFNGAGTVSFGSLTGSGPIQSGNNNGTKSISTGALGLNDIYSGIIANGSSTVALTKVGTGRMTLSGANTYTGTNNITAGKLIISTASLAKGVYLVASNATFGVTNTTTGSATISNLIVAAGSALEFQRVTNTVTPLIVASNLTVNGSCTVKIVGTNGLVTGTNYPLISYAGTFSGKFTDLLLQMPSGYSGTLVSNAHLVTLSVASLPGAPANLSATAGDGQVALAWSTVAGATGYNVKSSLTAGGAYTMVATNLSVPALTNTGLVNGTVYYYVVSTLNAGGESTNSIAASARPVSQFSTNLIFNPGINQIQLSWPADHTGWRLLTSTSLAAGNWADVSSNLVMTTNLVILPLSATNGGAFFRLVYP